MKTTMGTATVLVLGVLGVATPTAAQQDGPEPAAVSAEAFAGLAWLEGRWVGSGGGFDAFYEAYQFVNDSTLEQTTWPDDSFAEPDGRSTMELRGSRVVKLRDGRAQSTITRLAGDTIRFEWVSGDRPGFTWIRIDDDSWTAILDRRRGDPVVYTLRRIPNG